MIDEAKFAERRGIKLLPVRIEGADAPLGFGALHTVDLTGWDGSPEHGGIKELLRNLSSVTDLIPRPLRRMESFAVGGRSLRLPVFFRSVSSHETAVRPVDAVRALELLRPDAVLISAYDMINDPESAQMASDLEKYRAAGGVVMLDSGNYEAYRKADKTWQPDQLTEALGRTPYDLAFCYDQLETPADAAGVIKGVLDAVERDSKNSSKPILPIVHAPRDRDGIARAELLPEILARVVEKLRPLLVAVPERELGDGVLARAISVFEIRRHLDALGFYQPIHLLGTGNPISIAVFAAAGADSFDGLEWCRTVVDHETARLYHFQQYEFFAWQSDIASSDVVREAAASAKVSFPGKVIFHNLEFFESWIASIREAIRTDKIDRLLTDKLPGGASGLGLLEGAVPQVFG